MADAKADLYLGEINQAEYDDELAAADAERDAAEAAARVVLAQQRGAAEIALATAAGDAAIALATEVADASVEFTESVTDADDALAEQNETAGNELAEDDAAAQVAFETAAAAASAEYSGDSETAWGTLVAALATSEVTRATARATAEADYAIALADRRVTDLSDAADISEADVDIFRAANAQAHADWLTETRTAYIGRATAYQTEANAYAAAMAAAGSALAGESATAGVGFVTTESGLWETWSNSTTAGDLAFFETLQNDRGELAQAAATADKLRAIAVAQGLKEQAATAERNYWVAFEEGDEDALDDKTAALAVAAEEFAQAQADANVAWNERLETAAGAFADSQAASYEGRVNAQA